MRSRCSCVPSRIAIRRCRYPGELGGKAPCRTAPLTAESPAKAVRHAALMEPPWCLMSMCSRNGLRVPHLICSRNLVPQGEGLVLGGEDEGLLDPVDVARQVGRVGLGIEHL